MTDPRDEDTPVPAGPDTEAEAPKPAGPEGERVAKVMSRAGVASRREAERMIVEGRVTVNGRVIDSPALDVTPADRIMVDGKPLEAPQETRLWLYYKPVGIVTTDSDEKGRQTIQDALPRDLPRVMTVGRLDLNSEGLLLLTNDGTLKRTLELPSTGWLRRYRVRVNGTPNDLTLAPLKRGITIEGEEFAPMEVSIDSSRGANSWLTVGIREGRNREIRRAMAHVGLTVNRLIRIGYGPFKLADMEKNEVREVKRRVLREQLGGLLPGAAEAEAPAAAQPRKPRASAHRGGTPEGEAARAPRAGRPERSSGASGRSAFGGTGARDNGPRSRNDDAPRPTRFKSAGGERGERPARKSWGEGQDRPARPYRAAAGERPERAPRPERTEDRPARPYRAAGGDRPDRPARKSWGEGQDRPARPYRTAGDDRPARNGREGGQDRPARPYRSSDGDRGERPARKDWGTEGRPDRPARAPRSPAGERPDRPAGKSWKPAGGDAKGGEAKGRGSYQGKPREGAAGRGASGGYAKDGAPRPSGYGKGKPPATGPRKPRTPGSGGGARPPRAPGGKPPSR